MNFDAERVEIRRLSETDLEQVVRMADTVAEAPHWPRKLYEEALRTDGPRPRIALVAQDRGSGDVAGFAIASLIPPEAELESIAVVAQVQRRGVGRRLFAALAAELREAGVEDMMLEVRASNLTAIRFYTAQNFKQTGTRSRYYTDPQEDAVLMALRLV